MSAPFSTELRSRPGTIRLGGEGQPVITIRVQMAHAWDTVRIAAPPTEPVVDVKRAAIEALDPEIVHHEDYAIKRNGFEVLDENASLSDVGATDGSIFLIISRRRRPVR